MPRTIGVVNMLIRLRLHDNVRSNCQLEWGEVPQEKETGGAKKNRLWIYEWIVPFGRTIALCVLEEEGEREVHFRCRVFLEIARLTGERII